MRAAILQSSCVIVSENVTVGPVSTRVASAL